jgi:diguanylate cyclase (GGDEF)-like protein
MPHHQIRKKVNKLLITLYALMVMGLSASLGVALYQNWTLKVQVIQSELARQAGVGNFIIESAIADATKSLAAAQRALVKRVNAGPLSALQAHEVLQESLNDFNAYSNSGYGGLLLYMDPQGELIARSDDDTREQQNFSDRAYFRNLVQNPELERTLGPLVKARTTGEWVFHVAVPIKDKSGQLRGVLAQQIQAVDIARHLARYTDTAKTPQLVSQSTGTGVSFVYPLALLSERGVEGIQTPYADFARRSTSPQDSFTWPMSPFTGEPKVFVGYEQSQLYGMLTTIHLPVSDVWLDFLLENLFLLGITGLALLLTTGLFLHLYRVSNRLTAALFDSYSDALTKIPNRRAFENFFPRVLREAARSQEPMAVLFIDIDHFKLFNDDFGHDGGDIALKAVAETLSGCAARPLDFVCRWGGEEFVVVLPHTTEAAATTLARKILDAVRSIQLKDAKGRFMRHVTVSIGIAAGTLPSSTRGEAMVSEADEAMQQAKKAGRDRYVIHQPPAGWAG